MRDRRKGLNALSIGVVVFVSLIPHSARAQRESLRGWVGVAYTTSVGQTDREGTLVFKDYPVIESIEPNSPAERAGLESGDTILAMNSQDLRKSPLPMASMIQPGQKIRFRFKRNDAIREVVVTVVPRPSGTSETLSVTMFQERGAPAEGGTPVASRPPVPATAREVRAREEMRMRVPIPPGAAIAPLIFGFGPRTLGVAGAELTGLNADLGSVMGISSRGIFVVNVALGTPAKESGLRSGDVIIKADRSPVGDPGELIRVMRESSGSSVRLQIVRKKKPQTITLRW
jgi:S1-C subfamily serine protease